MYVTKHVNTTTINSFILKLYIPHNHKAATTLSLSPTHLGHYIQDPGKILYLLIEFLSGL